MLFDFGFRFLGWLEMYSLRDLSCILGFRILLLRQSGPKFCLRLLDGFAFLFEFFEDIENGGCFVVHTDRLLCGLNFTLVIGSIAKFLLKTYFVYIYTSI